MTTAWWSCRGPRPSEYCRTCALRRRVRRSTSGAFAVGRALARCGRTPRVQGPDALRALATDSAVHQHGDRVTQVEEGAMATTLTSRADAVLERYRARTPNSAALYARARES